MQRSTVNGSLNKSSRRLFLAGVATLGMVGCREHGDLADMMDEADATADNVPGHSTRLFTVIKNVGDEAADFVWRNKGALAIAGTLIAFVNDPEPFITGARELGSETIERIVAPIAQRATSQFPWRSVWLLGLIGTVLAGARLIWTAVTRRHTFIVPSVPIIEVDSNSDDGCTLQEPQLVPPESCGIARLKNAPQRRL